MDTLRAKLSFFVSLSLIAIIGAILIFLGILNHRESVNHAREKLLGLAQDGVMLIRWDDIAAVDLAEDPTKTPAYQTLKQRICLIREQRRDVRRIFILLHAGSEGHFLTVADLFWDSENSFAPRYFTGSGDPFEVRYRPDVMMGLMIPTVDRQAIKVEGEMTLTGYAPLRNAEGKNVGVMGISIPETTAYGNHGKFQILIIVLFLLCLPVSVVLGNAVAVVADEPLQKLISGTRSVMAGNLQYRLEEVDGPREISELTEAFNKMIANLDVSRRMVQGYVMRAVQMLVKIQEARDKYTKGHSERVAQYAEKIARKMGMNEDNVSLMRDMGMLHDIGKMGIEEEILNKPDKLTREEWAKVRKHPEVGEEILRPIFLNREILSIVKHHHERFDGQGYPDQLKGEEISLFAQIISVADSFDAMTSPRAYRPAMAIRDAAKELEKHRGSQFNPKVVDLFLRILREEHKI